jgi:2'-5' RNA ligase
MDQIRLQIAVLLEEPAMSSIVELNHLARLQEASEFIIDGRNFFPHITIYPPLFPTKNIDEIRQRLRSLAKNFEHFSIRLDQVFSADGYLMLAYKHSEALYDLHKKVINELNPLREGILRAKYQSPEYMNTIPADQQELVMNYGYQYVLQYFHPHITIVKYDDQVQAEKLMSVIKGENRLADLKNVQINNVVLFEAGENAKCIKLIEKFALR